MYGGRYLGSGTYGCIFYPNVECMNKSKTFDGVGKVFADKEEFKEEREIGNFIKSIDTKGEYFNILLGDCHVNYQEIKKRDSNNECKHVSDDDDQRMYRQLIYKEKGTDLCVYLKNNKNKTLFDDEMKLHVIKLFDAVNILQKHKLVHLDLKSPNILISDSNKLLLIDFGLTCKYEELYNNSFNILGYSYAVYPPEFKIYVAFDKIKNSIKIQDSDYYNKLRIVLEQKFFSNNMGGFKGYKNVSFGERYQLTKVRKLQLSNFLDKLVDNLKVNKKTHEDKEYLYNYFTKNFANKADVFSIGYVLIEIFMRNFVKKQNEHRILDMNRFFEKIYNMDPYERLTLAQAKSEYVKMTSSTFKNESIASSSATVINLNTPETIVISNSNTSEHLSMEDCKKLKRKELKKRVVDSKLDEKNKKLKYLRKDEICEHLVKHQNQDKNTVYQTAKSKNNQVSKEECYKYYELNELKEIVDKESLPKSYKQLNKKDLCNQIYEHLDSSNKLLKTVKCGRKKK